jgi:hypothetical protein
VDWVTVLAAFVLSHLAGDYLLQTDFQAMHKFGGLGRDPVRRRALCAHVATYTLAFVPALIWIGGATAAVLVVAIAIPHLIIDDGRLLRAYVRRVKHVEGDPPLVVLLGVDQTLHLLCLAAAAALT